MTIRLVVACDGTPADRETIALERCQGFLPTNARNITDARAEAMRAGWSTRWDPATWPAPSVQQELCPACTRAVRS